jgi:hypothetical protein
MPRKRKKKKSVQPEKEWYEIEITGWEFNYNFGLNNSPFDFITGDFWESMRISLNGKIIKPKIKNATRAQVILISTWKLDDYWKDVVREKPPSSTGWIEIPRGDDTLQLNCFLPSRSFAAVSVAVAAGKVKHASISGTKLRYRKGEIRDLYLSTNRNEEED